MAEASSVCIRPQKKLPEITVSFAKGNGVAGRAPTSSARKVIPAITKRSQLFWRISDELGSARWMLRASAAAWNSFLLKMMARWPMRRLIDSLALIGQRKKANGK